MRFPPTDRRREGACQSDVTGVGRAVAILGLPTVRPECTPSAVPSATSTQFQRRVGSQIAHHGDYGSITPGGASLLKVLNFRYAPEVPVTYGQNDLGRRVTVGRKDKARGVPSSRLQTRCGPAANYMLGRLPTDAFSGLLRRVPLEQLRLRLGKVLRFAK